MGVFFLNRSQVVDWLHDKDGNTRISGCSENGHEEKNGSDEDVSIGLTPTSGAVHGANLCNLTMSQQSTIHWQRQHTDAGELLLHLSCFISALSLVAMCAEQSCKPQARATEKLDMVSLPLKDGESQTGMCCYQEWCVLLRNSALEWLLLCAYSIACHHMHAQQTRIACMARERSELEAKESLAQAQIAKLQQQLQELQFSYAAERSRSELLESKVCELELAVRNKDLQLAEFQSAEKEEFVQTQHELLEVTANVERAMPVLDKDESKGAALLQVKDGVPSLLHAVQDADHLAAERKAFQEELCGLREELKSLQEALKSATFFQKKQSEDNLDSAMLPETPTSGTKSPTFGKEFERPLRLSSASTTLPDRELGDDLEEQDASPEEVDSPSASAERLEETCRSDLASAAPLACGSSSSGFGGTTLTTFESMPPPICRPLCSSNASTRLPKDDLEEQGASSPEEASNVRIIGVGAIIIIACVPREDGCLAFPLAFPFALGSAAGCGGSLALGWVLTTEECWNREACLLHPARSAKEASGVHFSSPSAFGVKYRAAEAESPTSDSISSGAARSCASSMRQNQPDRPHASDPIRVHVDGNPKFATQDSLASPRHEVEGCGLGLGHDSGTSGFFDETTGGSIWVGFGGWPGEEQGVAGEGEEALVCTPHTWANGCGMRERLREQVQMRSAELDQKFQEVMKTQQAVARKELEELRVHLDTAKAEALAATQQLKTTQVFLLIVLVLFSLGCVLFVLEVKGFDRSPASISTLKGDSESHHWTSTEQNTGQLFHDEKAPKASMLSIQASYVACDLAVNGPCRATRRSPAAAAERISDTV
eukprot:symbB.v1.2.033321.t4/scaffold4122.1/size44328/2